MKKTALIILLLFITSGVFADELQVPFSCYPKQLQEVFNKSGRKLDLSGNDRTEESWGFVENKGSSYVIYTYKPATQEDFEFLIKILQGEN